MWCTSPHHILRIKTSLWKIRILNSYFFRNFALEDPEINIVKFDSKVTRKWDVRVILTNTFNLKYSLYIWILKNLWNLHIAELGAPNNNVLSVMKPADLSFKFKSFLQDWKWVQYFWIQTALILWAWKCKISYLYCSLFAFYSFL